MVGWKAMSLVEEWVVTKDVLMAVASVWKTAGNWDVWMAATMAEQMVLDLAAEKADE